MQSSQYPIVEYFVFDNDVSETAKCMDSLFLDWICSANKRIATSTRDSAVISVILLHAVIVRHVIYIRSVSVRRSD